MRCQNVSVLLGDPRLPYAYAVDGMFGAEELKAVEELRGALERLAGYRFVYLDDHARLIAVALACLPICFTNGTISRWEGGVLFGYFVLPITVLTLVVLSYQETRRRKLS
ncbi:hypothetical protein [Aidingimonas halophila]|uniref:Uncharacterized protein n=1 Tax=Aidingimonas halophila TaxID=574349 RepID=A0A1H3ED42_9GAMM|nr:hypothetical protein [Aidingimonas halophila]GHC33643.1 hypothetical protein GCM10008094_28070 [Aidingimonas halophila]SDX76611.1 hypothetical protein SAMN05443545_10786 [Aidingimonas halophila]